MTEVDFPDALPAGSRLHWYVLERVLGQGGFGITYLAHDNNLDRPVAIKEYLPTEIARRRSDASAWPHSDTLAKRYAWGLERFLLEARTLARFDHPNIVRVLSVFEANNTAYMVMRFEEGEDLATQLERRGTLPERQLTDCLLPILGGLELVHAAGFIHRDIKPENIYVRRDGSPVLLDFGSARQSFGSAKTLTILVAPGYAPLEQYYGDASTQGPWTDIYGLGATCYRAIAGHAPLDAVARAKGVLGSVREILAPAMEVGRGRYGEAFLAAVDRSLQLSEKDRPQSIAEWRRELVAGGPPESAPIESPVTPVSLARTTPSVAPPSITASSQDRLPAERVRPSWSWAALAAAALIVIGGWWAWGRVGAPMTNSATVATPSPVVPAAPPTIDASATPVVDAKPPPAAASSPIVSLESTKTREAPPPAAAKPVKRADATTSPPPSREERAVVKVPTSAAFVSSPPAVVTIARPATASSSAASEPVAKLPSIAAAPTSVVPSPQAAPRSARDEAIDAAEATLRRGDAIGAAQMLAPLAAAGASRAQVLLGRAQESRPNGPQNDFEAYVWYGIAARSGQAGAQAQRERVGAKLQPAEIRQANQIIERWKPRAGATP